MVVTLESVVGFFDFFWIMIKRKKLFLNGFCHAWLFADRIR